MGTEPGSDIVVSSRQERAIAARDGIEAGATRPAALVPSTFLEAQAFCGALASSDLVPSKLKDRAADVLVIVLSGIEVGLAPMQALRLHHVINGVPRLSADGIAAIVTASPACEYLEPIETTEERAVWRTKKRGRPEQTLTWTIERAKRAGLLADPRSKDRWLAYPGPMLNSRCKAELCRLVYPEIVAGLHSAEEARDGMIGEDLMESPRPGFVAPEPPPPVPESKRTRAPKARDAAPPVIDVQPTTTATVTTMPPPGITITTAAAPLPVPAVLDPAPIAPPQPEPDVSFGEDAPDAAADETITEFNAWLQGCKSKNELRAGRDKWIAWSRRHYPAGSGEAVAMQQAFARRNAEVP